MKYKNDYSRNGGCLLLLVIICHALESFVTWFKTYFELIVIIFIGLCSISLFVYSIIKKSDKKGSTQNILDSIRQNSILCNMYKISHSKLTKIVKNIKN